MALFVAGLEPPPPLTPPVLRAIACAGPEKQQQQAGGEAAEAPAVRLGASVAQVFEEALEVTWHAVPSNVFCGFTVEFTGDLSDPKRAMRAEPFKDVVIERVNGGTGAKLLLRNLQMGKRYLVAVEGRTKDGGAVRSPWVRGATLIHKGKTDKDKPQNLDPNMKSRLQCKACSCPGYISFVWAAVNSQQRCRRCGCQCWDHVSVESEKILRQREVAARLRLERKVLKTLPEEAVDWDERECDIWFCTDGLFHPRNSLGGEQRPASGFLPGLVSVVCPTTEGRQHFHLWLWSCFAAQSWPDKELVVVETYTDQPSTFLEQMAKSDPRLVYFKHKFDEDKEDWSIGVKRNIGNQLARGEYIASFDDDDLYAPEYLSTMVNALQDQKGQAIKLSSWYIFRTATCAWSFCDPIAWGLSKGVDETDPLVRKLTYGYGFSYVYRRQLAVEVWYEDINFGEDFAFMAKVQQVKGENSVLLLRDDFGICLHVQHGANTSNSIPLREVPQPEALDLSLMELSNHFAALRLTQIDSHPAGLYFGMKDPPSKRTRKVRVHFPGNHEIPVFCRTDATTEGFLKELWHVTGAYMPWKVFRTPPPEMAEEEKRDCIASMLLGIDFLADLPGAWMNLLPETSSGEQWRRLLEEAKRPLRYSERLGLRTTSIWLLPGEDGPEPALEENIMSEDYVLIRATCQKTNVKSFSGSFMVWLPRGSTVELLRQVLGRSLPSQARIMIERKGKGMAVVQNGEVVPERIIVSEYKGVKSFHMFMTRNLARVFLHLMRKIFPKPSVQRQLDEIEYEASGHPGVRKGLLGKLLRERLYPEMARAVGLPGNALEPPILSETLGEHISADLEMSHLCLETDWWLRNWEGVHGAFSSMNHHRQARGLEPLTDIAALDPTGRSQALATQMGEAQTVPGGPPPPAPSGGDGPPPPAGLPDCAPEVAPDGPAGAPGLEAAGPGTAASPPTGSPGDTLAAAPSGPGTAASPPTSSPCDAPAAAPSEQPPGAGDLPPAAGGDVRDPRDKLPEAQAISVPLREQPGRPSRIEAKTTAGFAPPGSSKAALPLAVPEPPEGPPAVAEPRSPKGVDELFNFEDLPEDI